MEAPQRESDSVDYIRRLRFPKEIERAFQEYYYSRMRPRVRASIYLMAGFSVLRALLEVISDDSGKPIPFGVGLLVSVALFNLFLVGLSFHRDFVRFWQPLVVGVTLISLLEPLLSSTAGAGGATIIYIGVIASRVQRLQFRWMAIQCSSILLISLVSGIFSVLSGPHDAKFPINIKGMDVPVEAAILLGVFTLTLFLMGLPSFVALRSERFERNEFFTKYSLAKERNDERQKREQTERMLHVLSQAIGGIVHDLGNPLTTVQLGAQTLLDFAESGETDTAMVQQFADMINDGAQMLNYLRLSLMEQTRVLEGKPVPVELKTTSLCHMVKAGAHYQKPRFVAGRKVWHDDHDSDLHVCVDEMRFITVFMNLIGNALKYSDGEVRINWRAHEDKVLVAVQDQGQQNKGISRDQAEKLFVAFGRLDTHAQIEGTGLGLLSVRKIAEAHDCEIYIEGYSDGTAASGRFSTAQGNYPQMLEAEFRTAFVITCPLNTTPDPKNKEAFIAAPAPTTLPLSYRETTGTSSSNQ